MRIVARKSVYDGALPHYPFEWAICHMPYASAPLRVPRTVMESTRTIGGAMRPVFDDIRGALCES